MTNIPLIPDSVNTQRLVDLYNGLATAINQLSLLPGPTGPSGDPGPTGPSGTGGVPKHEILGTDGHYHVDGYAPAIGDMIRAMGGEGGPNWENLGIGTAGQVLTVFGWVNPIPGWADPSGAAGPTGPTGPSGGPPGPTGPTGSASTVPGPTGPTGPAGAASSVAGPTGPTGPTGAATTDIGLAMAVGTAVTLANNTERSKQSPTYVKIKEIKFNQAYAGNLTVGYQMKSGPAGRVVYAKTYKNGSAVGDENSDSSGSYQSFSDYVTGPFAPGDLIQVWVHYATLAVAYVKNMSLQYKWAITAIAGHALATALPTTDTDEIDVTNQDPS